MLAFILYSSKGAKGTANASTCDALGSQLASLTQARKLGRVKTGRNETYQRSDIVEKGLEAVSIDYKDGKTVFE